MADFDFAKAQQVASALAKALNDPLLSQVPSIVDGLSKLAARESELKSSIAQLEKQAENARTKEAAAVTGAIQTKNDADNETRRIFAACEKACETARLNSQRELEVLETNKRKALEDAKAAIADHQKQIDAKKAESAKLAESKAALESHVGNLKAKMTEFLQ